MSHGEHMSHKLVRSKKKVVTMSSPEEKRAKTLEDYRKKLIEHRELDAKLKKSKVFTRSTF